jgi:hypothetical protein
MEGINVVGRWNLISIQAENPDGDVRYPYGEGPFGMLMYDADGYMSILIMRRNRSKFASGDMFGGTPEELKEAFEGFDAYCGTYEVDEEQSIITHHIEGARFPNFEMMEQVRFFEFFANRLIIKSKPIPSLGTEWVVTLMWERPTK